MRIEGTVVEEEGKDLCLRLFCSFLKHGGIHSSRVSRRGARKQERRLKSDLNVVDSTQKLHIIESRFSSSERDRDVVVLSCVVTCR